MDTEPTLEEALAARGLTHKPTRTPGVRSVETAAGMVVFRGRAGEVWAWLKATEVKS